MTTQIAIGLEEKLKLETVVGISLIVISGILFFILRIMREPVDLIIILILVGLTVLGIIMLTLGVNGFVNDGKRPPGTGYT